ncbi:MAG: hypothetical protein EHM36_03285 [Deltaproteobacteria bacterium]|nr:MAG: hypothetical protein EHM36_03285 [Deltaproteobacteria bacterium]
MRRCRYCGVEKDESEFHVGPNGYLRWKCKDCYKEDLIERRMLRRSAQPVSFQCRECHRVNGFEAPSEIARTKIGNPIQFHAESGANYAVRVERILPGPNGNGKPLATGNSHNPAPPIEVRLIFSVGP